MRTETSHVISANGLAQAVEPKLSISRGTVSDGVCTQHMFRDRAHDTLASDGQVKLPIGVYELPLGVAIRGGIQLVEEAGFERIDFNLGEAVDLALGRYLLQ